MPLSVHAVGNVAAVQHQVALSDLVSPQQVREPVHVDAHALVPDPNVTAPLANAARAGPPPALVRPSHVDPLPEAIRGSRIEESLELCLLQRRHVMYVDGGPPGK